MRGAQVINEKLIRKRIEKSMVLGRLARPRTAGPGGVEVVNEKLNKELNREMGGFR